LKTSTTSENKTKTKNKSLVEMLKNVLLFLLLLPIILNAQERIELADGSTLSVFMAEPNEMSAGSSPLVILMAGGPGNLSITQDTARWLGLGFAQRGWIVAVPVSPNNRSFRGAENNGKIEQLIAALQLRGSVGKDQVLLAGVSNGGMSALEIARRNTSKYYGVVAVPALFRGATKDKSLAGLPVYLRIGGNDQLGWTDQFAETAENLANAGALLDAEILEGAPHMFRMDWTTLGPWLEKIRR
jgi:dienelactone hydrolase